MAMIQLIENWKKISQSVRYPERVVERGPHEISLLV